MVQSPFPITGTVTYNSSVYRGAKIWLQDITEGTNAYAQENLTFAYTNASGQYVIDLANVTSAYANLDKVRVYCEIENMGTWTDIVISLGEGSASCDFTITRKSGLTDGIKSTQDDDGKYGLSSIGRGLKIGMKDALQ
jgi:hypothetical protein